MGTGRVAAARIRARPPWREPVKPTAWIAGCPTSARLRSWPAPASREKTPSCRPHRWTARRMARPTSSEVPGCAGCALTTTGAPAARAEAVSPPATEKARGKLLAPKTATGPTGMWRRRMSPRGSGVRSGRARSTRAPTQSPSRTTRANRRSWFTVRPRSPSKRGRGRPVSRMARSISASPRSRIDWAMASRNAARASGLVSR